MFIVGYPERYRNHTAIESSVLFFLVCTSSLAIRYISPHQTHIVVGMVVVFFTQCFIRAPYPYSISIIPFYKHIFTLPAEHRSLQHNAPSLGHENPAKTHGSGRDTSSSSHATIELVGDVVVASTSSISGIHAHTFSPVSLFFSQAPLQQYVPTFSSGHGTPEFTQWSVGAVFGGPDVGMVMVGDVVVICCDRMRSGR